MSFPNVSLIQYIYIDLYRFIYSTLSGDLLLLLLLHGVILGRKKTFLCVFYGLVVTSCECAAFHRECSTRGSVYYKENPAKRVQEKDD